MQLKWLRSQNPACSLSCEADLEEVIEVLCCERNSAFWVHFPPSFPDHTPAMCIQAGALASLGLSGP